MNSVLVLTTDLLSTEVNVMGWHVACTLNRTLTTFTSTSVCLYLSFLFVY